MQQHEEESIEVHESHHHIVSPVVYLTIVLCLLVATGLTVWASYIDLGEWHITRGLRSSGIPSSPWPSLPPR